MLGVVLLVVGVGPVWTACRVWRQRLIPSLARSEARLVEVVVSLGIILIVGEIMGASGLLDLPALIAVLAGLGTLAWYAGERSLAAASRLETPLSRQARGDGQRRVAIPPWGRVLSLAAMSIVVADWSTRVADGLHHGMGGVDTLWYHMPFAARFAQLGSTTALHYVDTEAVTVFFPANSELFHSVGIVVMGSDVLSPLLNMGWLFLSFLAAWCVGQGRGLGPVSLTGAAVLLGTPGLVGTQPGEAYTDIVTFGLVMSSVALILSSRRLVGRERLLCVAAGAIPAGIAFGTKFTAVAPVVALTLGIWVISGPRERVRTGITWTLLVLLTGSYWYLRNLIAVGNPVPSFHLNLGPIHLHGPPTRTPSSTVAHFLFSSHAWSQYFLPGFRLSLGPAWWAILVLSVGGLLLGCLPGSTATLRMIGLVGIASAIAFIFTPQFLTLYGAPYYFVYNLRYSFIAVIIGLTILPLAPLLATQQRVLTLLGLFVVVLAFTQLDGSIWPTSLFFDKFGQPVRGVDSLLGALAGAAFFVVSIWWRFWTPKKRLLARPVVGWGLLAAAVACGIGVTNLYLDDRYAGPSNSPMAAAYAWAQGIRGARIAVVGPFADLQYPLYGKDVSNHVQYIGIRGAYGSYSPVNSCEEWRQALREGNYGYALVTGPPGPVTSIPEGAWTLSDPGSQVVVSAIQYGGSGTKGLAVYVLRVRSKEGSEGCPGASLSGAPVPR